jgi:hypothetical protein
MTVIKKYNSNNAQWEKIVVGRSGEWDTAQLLRTETASTIIVASDIGRLLVMDSGSATTVTVDTSNGLTPGQRVDILRAGAGSVEVVGSGVTVNGTPGLFLRAQWSVASLVCWTAGVFVLVGDLDA